MHYTKTNKTLNIVLWIAQVGLAGIFIMAGFMKTFTPINELAGSINWASDLPALIRFVGISELLGGIGLIFPALLKIKPVLTPIAAGALALVMLFAIVFHLVRAEFPAILFNIVLGAVALFIAWGRSRKAPVLARA